MGRRMMDLETLARNIMDAYTRIPEQGTTPEQDIYTAYDALSASIAAFKERRNDGFYDGLGDPGDVLIMLCEHLVETQWDTLSAFGDIEEDPWSELWCSITGLIEASKLDHVKAYEADRA